MNCHTRRAVPSKCRLAGTQRDKVDLDQSAAFFRIRTATATYGISRSFIYRALTAGKVVAVKAGRSVLIDGSSLRQVLGEPAEGCLQSAAVAAPAGSGWHQSTLPAPDTSSSTRT